MTDIKYSTAEEVFEELKFAFEFSESEYMENDPEKLYYVIVEFIQELTKLSKSKFVVALLESLVRDMARPADRTGVDYSHNLYGILKDAMNTDAVQGPHSNAHVISFPFPIGTIKPLNDSFNVYIVASFVLYFWNGYFPMDNKYLKKSTKLEVEYQKVAYFCEKHPEVQDMMATEREKGSRNIGRNPADAPYPADVVSLPMLKRFLAKEDATAAKYAADTSAEFMDSFKKLDKIFISKPEKANLEKSIKAATAAKEGYDVQKNSFADIIGKNKADLEALMQGATDFAKYKDLDGHFDEKADSHNRQFRLWLGLFLATLIVIMLTIWWNADIIPGLAPVYEAGKFRFGNAILLVTPTLIFVWILRVFIRLAMLNLQLREDSRNRTVLIRTLAALENDEKNVLPPEQKLIALNAIFRSSLAADSNLDVAHPSIGDLSGFFKR